jgi:hypothetical protein
MRKSFGSALALTGAPMMMIMALAATSGTSARAADTATQTTTATAQAAEPNVLDSLYVNVFSNFHGPSLGRLDSPYKLSNTGAMGKAAFDAINFDSELTTAYMLTKDVGIGPDVPFLLVPVLGQGFILGDVGLKMFDRKTISGNGFTLATNLLLQASTSDYSQQIGQDFAIKTTPSVRYRASGSRFAVGAWTEAKAYLGVDSPREKTFKLWAGPYVAYQLTPTVALQLQYEMEARHMKNKPNLDFTNYQTDLMPNVSWMITPHVMFNPYLQLFTGNKVTADSTAVGALFSATVL